MIWSTLLTGQRKYLDALRPALKWYQEHRTDRGWPAFYDSDGTPITPSNWYSGEGWYGPAYGHFKDITYIQEAIRRLDAGTYGVCTACGAGVAFERLLVFPESATCLACSD